MRRMFAREKGSLEEIFDELDRYAARRGLGERDSYFARLAAEELFTNTLRHAPGGASEVLLEVEVVKDALTVRLTDFNTEPFDGNIAVPLDTALPLSHREPGGLGLHLLRRLADDLVYEYSAGNLIATATKRLEE